MPHPADPANPADPGSPAGRPAAGDPSDQHDGGTPPSLGGSLARFARELQGQPSPQAVLERVVHAAVALVPGAEVGTVSLVRARRRISSQAATSETGRAWDALQDRVHEGPCLDAMYEQRTLRVADLAGERRWPRLAERAEEAGVRSVLCFQLFTDGDTLGALNLLSERPDAFHDESEDVGLLFSAHAAVALAAAVQLHHVHRALEGRDTIGQAKGILMERFKVSADVAFDLLSRASQDGNRKLQEVAGELCATGTLTR